MSTKPVTYSFLTLLLVACWLPISGEAQPEDEITQRLERLEKELASWNHQWDVLDRKLDQTAIYEALQEVADCEFKRLTGPPLRPSQEPGTTQGAGNPLIVYTHVFLPKDLDGSAKYPLILLPHGGVHSHLTPIYIPILKELLLEGYVVAAPEYRGSTGFGRAFFEAIDYGGLEIEDTLAVRDFMLETYPFLDSNRVGIVGWSHGGLHALLSVFRYPEKYAAAYAGVPVSDLVARMGYKTQGYRNLFEADYHIGKSAYEDVEEYMRRSPSWNVEAYQGTPLLIHTTTNDEDVNVLEVRRLIEALKAAGKTGFQYKIYEDASGGHLFNRVDTPLAKESRREIYDFLRRYLRP